jgi:hypothetical protein
MRTILNVATTKYQPPFQMSRKVRKKECQIPGKGSIESFEIANPLEPTPTVANALKRHVPETGGT